MTDLHNNGISVTAWGPFSMGIRRKTARRPRRQRCGGTLKGRQRIPKYRIVENAGLFDLRLSAENMKRIDGLGRRLPFGRDPDVFGGHIG